MKFDFVIAGAGYSGCILAERITSESDKKVLIIEQRNHIAGNAYDYYDENGVLIHKYGPHIFHTSVKKVWDYLSNFTGWNSYVHKVNAVIEGKNVPVPFNFNSIYQLFPHNYAGKIEDLLLGNFPYGMKIPILKLMKTENPELKFLADYIYKNVFLGYTSKQWGMKPEELDFSVSSRVPVYLSRDDRYFQDTYQGLPAQGYTEMFKKIIDNKNIHLLLNTDYKDVIDDIKYDYLIYTGQIDSFFNYEFGELPYRSLKFDFKSFDKEYFQNIGQLNFPNNYDYTRITEFKHLSRQIHSKTTVAYEYPQPHTNGVTIPYYPIPKDDNHLLFGKYRDEADKLKNIFFTGRLADYKYYNMDETVYAALRLFNKEISKLI